MTRVPALAIFVAAGCSVVGGAERPPERLAACPAPGGRAVATLTRVSGGGAAGWEFSQVRVHRPGVPPNSVRPAFVVNGESGGRGLHAYWDGPGRLVVEYAAAGDARVEAEQRLGADTVLVLPRPVRGMQLDLSDVPSCAPYRPGGPLAPPPAPVPPNDALKLSGSRGHSWPARRLRHAPPLVRLEGPQLNSGVRRRTATVVTRRHAATRAGAGAVGGAAGGVARPGAAPLDCRSPTPGAVPCT